MEGEGLLPAFRELFSNRRFPMVNTNRVGLFCPCGFLECKMHWRIPVLSGLSSG
jgi:hypothetical protein